MDARSAQIATICECIDHCFVFDVWCNDFAQAIDPDDLVNGLDRGFDLVSDATRLQSFLALRKLDEFFGGVKAQADDLVAVEFDIDVPSVLEGANSFLSSEERTTINKGVTHLTNRLSPDPDSEVDLAAIVKRSIPVFSRLTSALRAQDTGNEASQWLGSTDTLIKRYAR
ncbi:hypothetical protein V9K92_01125 [Phyllobacterium sp. CCNWLW109]|uniref:hypothetical protein n=1 Tax=Phyllobacterium sp. CCNWLW109 TaxID=3127479 RepID=UPI003076D209